MFRLRNNSFARRLTLMNMAVSATAVVLACVFFVVYDVDQYRRNMLSYASSQAELVGSNSVSALLFNDQAAARKTLAALSSAPNIDFAGVYKPDGQPFVTYFRAGGNAAPPLPQLSNSEIESYTFEAGELNLVQRIVFQGKPVGFTYIQMSSQALDERIRLYIGIAIAVLGFSLLAALGVSYVFQRVVSEPIVHLAEVAETVSREHQLSARAAPKRGGYEVAVLVNAFNDMLDQIQERDQALQQARESLEARVRERTAELQRKEEHLRSLSGHLLRLQDEERRRIARELHDSTGQVLAAFAMNLAIVQGEAGHLSPGGINALNECLEMVKQISRELRTMSHLLHPPLLDEAGLESALSWYVQGFAERSGIQATLEIPPQLGRLPRDLEIAIFRIVQESLTNVHRHSGSKVALVRISRDAEKIEVEVADEGRGVQATNGMEVRPGVGIQGMRERVSQMGGQFEVRSGANGTTIAATFPLAQSVYRSDSDRESNL